MSTGQIIISIAGTDSISIVNEGYDDKDHCS